MRNRKAIESWDIPLSLSKEINDIKPILYMCASGLSTKSGLIKSKTDSNNWNIHSKIVCFAKAGPKELITPR